MNRVVHNPKVMGGKPCIRGTRVTVGMIVGMLAAGHTQQALLSLYPYLSVGDIAAALEYAAWRSQEQDLPMLTDEVPDRHESVASVGV